MRAVAAAPGAARRWRTLAAWLLVAFLAVLPFRSSVALRNVALWSAVAALVIAAWHARDAWRSWLPTARIAWPLAAWTAWCALSVAWSVSPAESATELRPELFTPLAAFLAFHAVATEPHALDRWIAALAAGLAVLALGAFWQEAFDGAWDPRRWHVDVGYYSTHAALVLPLLAWTWLRHRGSLAVHAAIVAVGLATLVAVYWTDNRVVWPTLAAMAVVAAVLGGATSRIARWRLAVWALLAVALAAAFFILAQQERQETLLKRRAAVNADLATDPRFTIWPEALARLEASPWLGRGFSRATLRQPDGWKPDGIQDPRQWHAHNVFLNVALQLGLAGLAIFAWIGLAFARELAAHLAAPPPRRWVAILGLTLLAGFVVKNFTDDFLVRHTGLLCWALAGALLGYLRAKAPA